MHKNVLTSLFCALSLCTAAVLTSNTPASGQQAVIPLEPQTPPPLIAEGPPVDETPNLWFVELASPPTADGTPAAVVRNEKAAFRAAAQKAGLKFTERYAFDTLWNGLSVKIDRSQLATLARIPGVKNIYPVQTIPHPAPDANPSPELFTSLEMIGAKIAQDELGFTGKGIKVAVMDTGIDYDHSDLGGDGVARSNSDHFPTTRVAYGYDLVGDAYNVDPSSAPYDPVPHPDPYPDDCYGHGTHVAGIIGANGVVKGVAPDVIFGAYRVFGCQGSTSDDVMLAAMELALADGMQILNMSIGSPFTWPQYPTAQASDRLVNKGIVVVASIGNSGANGLYSAGAPGLGKKVIGVASYDNTHVTLPTFTVSPDKTVIGYTVAAGAPNPPTSGTFPLARTGTKTSTADACSALPAGSLSGKVALIRRGTCSFYIKAMNAQNAGAVAVVLYNNVAGRVNPTVAGSPPVTIPVVAISDTEGVLINDRLASGPVDLTWTDQKASFPSPTANLISSFSSYGLSPDLELKPDLGAPGGNIYSTYPLELGKYANMSGTSMSSPHVAGAVALLLQAQPKTPAQAVRDMLQNSAVAKPWWGNPTSGFLDNVARQGAGMIQIDKAILATAKITPGKISVGESQAGPYTEKLTVENRDSAPVTYDLTYVNALSVRKTFAPAFSTSDAVVSFNTTSITVPGGGSASITATVMGPSGPTKALYGGYITFTPRGIGETYSVPFAGFVGDYQSIQVLAPTPNGFPWLAFVDAGAYNKLTDPSDWTFTMQADDIPYLLVHLDHQSRRLRAEIFEKSGKAWHRAFEDQYLPRNSNTTGFFAIPFDGTTYNGVKTSTVPDGEYYLKLSVLKALGDENNPADWETWTSPNFVIDRP